MQIMSSSSNYWDIEPWITVFLVLFIIELITAVTDLFAPSCQIEGCCITFQLQVLGETTLEAVWVTFEEYFTKIVFILSEVRN